LVFGPKFLKFARKNLPNFDKKLKETIKNTEKSLITDSIFAPGSSFKMASWPPLYQTLFNLNFPKIHKKKSHPIAPPQKNEGQTNHTFSNYTAEKKVKILIY
jgi:hypothetical protein